MSVSYLRVFFIKTHRCVATQKTVAVTKLSSSECWHNRCTGPSWQHQCQSTLLQVVECWTTLLCVNQTRQNSESHRDVLHRRGECAATCHALATDS